MHWLTACLLAPIATFALPSDVFAGPNKISRHGVLPSERRQVMAPEEGSFFSRTTALLEGHANGAQAVKVKLSSVCLGICLWQKSSCRLIL